MAVAGNVIRVAAKQRLQEQTVLNVYHFQLGNTVPDFQVIEDLAFRIDFIHFVHAAIASTELQFTTIEMYNATTETFLGEVGYVTLSAGTVGSDALPNGVAGLVTMPTSQAKTRGRKFYAGLSESGLSEGVFFGLTLSGLVSIGARIIEEFEGDTSGQVYRAGVLNQLGLFRDFTAFTVINIPSYQRRRKQGVGV
jgi:hypothetical protein